MRGGFALHAGWWCDVSDFKAPWSWDDKVWEECDPMQRAPWLVDAAGNPVLKGDMRCASEELARLIEAAPELFEALRGLIGWVPGPESWHTDACPKAVERAVAAMAKALGTAP